MRILCIDPGAKRLGLAISDPTGTIASPLRVLQHISRAINAATIAQIAVDENVEKIIVGQSLDDEGKPTFEGRRAGRLAKALRAQTNIPIELWDEYGSTQQARAARTALGSPRRKRQGHLDKLAAAIILQSYLDAHRS